MEIKKIHRTFRKLALAAMLPFATSAAHGQSVCPVNNLWVNGTFESGTGTQCDIFNPINAYSNTGSPFYGYTTFIFTAGNSLQPTYVNEATIDHTTGAAGGHYLYADPRGNSGQTSQIKQSIKVKASTTYTFSAWFCSMLKSTYVSDPAVVQLYVNGAPVSTSLTLNSTSINGWQQLTGTWTASANATVDVEIMDMSPVVGGHDFAVDDISFGTGSINVNAGRDTSICAGTQLKLGGAPTADYGATCGSSYTYKWTPSTGIISATNIANPTISIATPGTYTYTVQVTDLNGNSCTDQVRVNIKKCNTVCSVNNLWVNGTFENATVGNHCNIFNPVNAASSASPYYGYTTFIWTAGTALQPAYVNEATIDHTTGAAGGHYLYADPRTNTGQTSQIKQSIKVKPGATYTFSAWLCSTVNTTYVNNPAVVQLYVNGAPVSSSMTLNSTALNGWQQLSGSWTAPSTGGYVDVEIMDMSPVVGGHDFAVDDIFFGSGTIDVDAGPDATLCLNQAYTLGGSPTADYGATCNSEYTYSWSPATGFTTASNIANPSISLGTPGTYTYTVTVTDLNGNSCKDAVVITVNDCKVPKRMMLNETGSSIKVYPNPVSNTLTFSELPEGTAHIVLYNMNGQKMMSATSEGSSTNMNVSSLASGIYFYIIADESGKVIAKDKVIKQ